MTPIRNDGPSGVKDSAYLKKAEARRNEKSAEQKPVPQEQPKDRVTLSGDNSIEERVQEAAMALPEVDLERVAEYRAAVREGRYITDTDETADALLAEALMQSSFESDSEQDE